MNAAPHDAPRSDPDDIARLRRALDRAAHLLRASTRSFLRGLVVAPALGLLAAVPLVGRVLLLRATGRTRRAVARAALPPPRTSLDALCLLVAASGKSALLPVGTWLPRAVEGPTPSSALDYCALSVHAGAYLLLRSNPVLRAAPLGAACVAAVGLGSAALATMIGRAQVDAKGAVAWASMTHVGLVVAEVGLGFPRVALVHLVAHAILRTWQMLRAPSWLHDELALRAAADGAQLPTGSAWGPLVPARALDALYRLAYDRFFFETAQQRYIAGPVLRLGRYLDRAERRWVEAVGAWHPSAAPPDSERPSARNTRVEEAQHEP